MSRSITERLTAPLIGLLAGCAIAILILVVALVLRETWPALQGVGLTRFLADDSWHPTEDRFGMGPMLWASIASALGAVLVAVPFGVIGATFCRFYAQPQIASCYRRALGVFAGIPSVVYGFWGLTVLVPMIADRHPPGASLVTGIIILALMIFPTIALTSETALAGVPASYLHAGYALGMSKATVVFKIALRAASGGILVGAVLALARALGETMAILMVSGNVVQVPATLFEPVRTLAANIALEMAYAAGVHRSSLFASGGFLILIVMTLLLFASHITGRRHHG